MILTIRKPIARFMRYAFGRKYVFVLAKSGRTKLRRVFTSDWNGEEYIHDDDLFLFSWSRVRLKDTLDGTFRDWKPATFTEGERKAQAVMDALHGPKAPDVLGLDLSTLGQAYAAFAKAGAPITVPKPKRFQS